MPLEVPPAGVMRMSFSGTNASTKWANVFHLYLPGNTLDVTSLPLFLSDIANIFELQLFYAACSGGLGVSLLKGDLSDGANIISGETAPGFSGTDIGEPLPGAVSACISWLGAWHYRGGHPRTYLPGGTVNWLSTPDSLDGTFLATQSTNVLNTMTEVDAYTSGQVPVCILGVLLGNTGSSHGTFAPYGDFIIRPRPANQRRRNRG